MGVVDPTIPAITYEAQNELYSQEEVIIRFHEDITPDQAHACLQSAGWQVTCTGPEPQAGALQFHSALLPIGMTIDQKDTLASTCGNVYYYIEPNQTVHALSVDKTEHYIAPAISVYGDEVAVHALSFEDIPLYPGTCTDTVQGMVIVPYINGVLGVPVENYKVLRKVEELVRSEIYSRFSTSEAEAILKKLLFKSYFNHSNGLSDFIESSELLALTEWGRIFEYLADLSIAPNFVQNAARRIILENSSNMLNSVQDITEFSSLIRDQLRHGNGVSVLSHSEGTIMAKALHTDLYYADPIGGNYVNFLILASPLQAPIPGNPYILTENDIITSISGLTPNHQFSLTETKDFDLFSHSMLKTYLQASLGNMVAKTLVDQILSVEKPPAVDNAGIINLVAEWDPTGSQDPPAIYANSDSHTFWSQVVESTTVKRVESINISCGLLEEGVYSFTVDVLHDCCKALPSNRRFQFRLQAGSQIKTFDMWVKFDDEDCKHDYCILNICVPPITSCPHLHHWYTFIGDVKVTKIGDSSSGQMYSFEITGSMDWVNVTNSNLDSSTVHANSVPYIPDPNEPMKYATVLLLDKNDPGDTDGDGLSDYDEVDKYGTDPTLPDTDGDGLLDKEEVLVYGTDAKKVDTDNDGIPDKWEITNGLNPLSGDDALQDKDSDGLTNLGEYQNATDPNKADTDNDGIPDGWEVLNSLNPLVNDAAQDTDLDGLSNLREYQSGTDPRSNIDSDGDGMSNDWEYVYGLDPNTNDALQDMDQDGVTNVAELVYGTDPSKGDTDNDGISDNYEIALVDIGYPNADPTNSNLIPDQAAIDVYNSLKSCSSLHIRNTRTNTEYPSLQDAYNAALSGDTLQTHAVSLYEDLNLDRNISITLQGGYDCGYTTNPVTTALRTKNGSVNITLGTVTAGNMVVQTDYDNDSDGMPSSWEVFSGLNPMVDDSRGDPDLDRLNNLDEYQFGTNPQLRKDTDGDRMMDDWEKAKGLNPSVADGGSDKDGDGLTNLQEFLAGTDPNSTDTDGDGVSDYDELALQKVGYPNADPADPNITPNMSLPDVQAALNVYNSFINCTHLPVRIAGGNEYHSIQAAYADANNGDSIQIHAKGFFENFAATLDISVNIQGGFDCGYTTNPVYTTMKTTGGAVNISLGTVTMGNVMVQDAPDTDGDGMPDEWEMAYGLNPVDSSDAHQDSDGDGLDNLSEFLLSTDPTNPDTDSDGLLDPYDTDPLDPNPIMVVANGDINDDGVVDAADVMLAQRIFLGLITPTADQIAHGDVAPAGAPDGVINGADVLVIQRKALGLQ